MECLINSCDSGSAKVEGFPEFRNINKCSSESYRTVLVEIKLRFLSEPWHTDFKWSNS